MIYTFFHHSDLDFVFQVYKVEEHKKIFFNKFKKYLENNYENGNNLLNRYAEKVTSIYDFSLNMAMSSLISNFIQTKFPILNKMMTEVTKSSNVTNLMLWDVNSKLYVIKDDVPFDDNKFAIFLDYLEMYYKLINFYGNKS